MQVDPNKPPLKAPETKRLTLKYDEPPSNFDFKFNLRRYIKWETFTTTDCAALGNVPGSSDMYFEVEAEVGRCRLTR